MSQLICPECHKEQSLKYMCNTCNIIVCSLDCMNKHWKKLTNLKSDKTNYTILNWAEKNEINNPL